jgi:deoxyribodipyrimidine photo-lyase
VHPKELPFPIKFLPDIFTEFRKQVEKTSKIMAPFPAPTSLKVPGGIQVGNIELPEAPVPSAFLPTPGGENLGALTFKGGETEGKKRLEDYFWNGDHLRNYKETRNGLLGADYSSKFSAWLSVGALSPRYIYQQVKQYEAERVSNDSTYWLIFELLWRDYFRYVAKKYGDTLFREGGIRNKPIKYRNNAELFGRWAQGQTGAPFIDANMRELLASGFMSNRGRQNVASYFVKDLGLNWQLGAAWFEYLLVDYDPCSNWGNWNYVAGVGNDPRENRYFNIAKQAETYDPKGFYIKTWLPELSKVPAYRLNHPDDWSRQEMKDYGITFGNQYPFPVVKARKEMA